MGSLGNTDLIAIVAQDVGHPAGILFWHGRAGNLLIHPPPDCGQISIRLHADGTRELPA